jgi:hypothetical protein
MSQLIKGY